MGQMRGDAQAAVVARVMSSKKDATLADFMPFYVEDEKPAPTVDESWQGLKAMFSGMGKGKK